MSADVGYWNLGTSDAFYAVPAFPNGIPYKSYATWDLGFGFNADTGEYGDLFEMGILDPTKVVRCALQNATSVASLLLTTECVIADEPEKKASPKGAEAV